MTPDPSHFYQAEGTGIPYLVPFLLTSPQELNNYTYAQSNPINLMDPVGLVCGSWWNDWAVPDAPGGFDFTSCCQQHDDCYGGKYNQCDNTKEQCDEEFYRCMKRICDLKYLANKECYGYASKYWNAVVKHGTGAFESAREKGPCNPCED